MNPRTRAVAAYKRWCDATGRTVSPTTRKRMIRFYEASLRTSQELKRARKHQGE